MENKGLLLFVKEKFKYSLLDREYDLTKNSCYFSLPWDYNVSITDSILVSINNISAYICQNSRVGGATIVELHSDLKPLIELCSYFNATTHKMGNRYSVVYNDNIGNDVIYVYRPFKSIPTVTVMDETFIINPSPFPEKILNIEDYKRKLRGYIKISGFLY